MTSIDPDLDAHRDAYLAALGIEVLRIPNRRFFMLANEPHLDAFREIQKRGEANASISKL